MPSGPESPPRALRRTISYAAGGGQHVAVPTGVGIFRDLSGVLGSDIDQPPSGNGPCASALPDQESAP